MNAKKGVDDRYIQRVTLTDMERRNESEITLDDANSQRDKRKHEEGMKET